VTLKRLESCFRSFGVALAAAVDDHRVDKRWQAQEEPSDKEQQYIFHIRSV
jgi:hypothetical protein